MKQVRTVYHLMVPLALALLSPFVADPAWGQGQELPPIKVDLPPPPNFNIQTAPEKYPTGEMSIYGLRKHMRPVPGQRRSGQSLLARGLRVSGRAAQVQ